MVERIRFSSGLELAFRRFKDLKSASIGIWVRRGACTEPLKYKGIAHYLEHLLFKGSRRYSHKKIKQQIEGRGGQLNAFTSQEITCYFAKTLDKNTSITLDVLSDMVTSPLLRKQDIDKERGVILEEIRMYNDMPSSRVSTMLDSLMWGKHPLGIDVIGSTETVKRVDQKSLRDFKRTFYRPSNVIVVVCGPEIPPDFKKKILKRFNHDSKGPTTAVFPKAKFSAGFKLKEEVTSFEQSHLSLGFPAFSYFDEQRYALEIAHVILGANMSSRLFEEIREKRGLAYEVATGIRKHRHAGAFIIHCGLEAKNVSLAFKVILDQLKKIKHKGVGRLELSRAKDYLLGNLSISLESTLNSMFYIGESLCSRNRVIGYKEVEKKIRSISAAEVRAVCRKVLSYDTLKVAIVTNRKKSYASEIKAIVKRAG
ncbi:M16 family metallopeptidase [Candidatus Omnitrophota bacterium]